MGRNAAGPRFEVIPAEGPPRCAACGNEGVERIQPDLEDADRLVLVCHDCRSWTLHIEPSDESGPVAILLPDASAARPPGG